MKKKIKNQEIINLEKLHRAAARLSSGESLTQNTNSWFNQISRLREKNLNTFYTTEYIIYMPNAQAPS